MHILIETPCKAMMLRRILLLLTAVSASPTYPSDPPMLIDKVVPFQRWTEHGSYVTGLIFTSPATTSNMGISWTRGITNHDPYWFSVDGDSPQVLYWPSKGEGENFLSNWNVDTKTGGTRQYDAAMFTPNTPNSYGLKKEMHVVRLEINDKYGSTNGVHFVATDTQVVWTPTKHLSRMRAKFDRWVRSKGHKAQAVIEVLQNRIINQNPGGNIGNQNIQVAEFPTYHNGCLLVTFYRQLSNTLTYPPEIDPSYYCEPGTPCAPPPYTQRVIEFGVEEYIQYEKCRGKSKLKKTGVDRKRYIKDSRRVASLYGY